MPRPGAPPEAFAGYVHCPVCGVETPYPIGTASLYPVVCSNCLCMFALASGRVTQAPPIMCAAELAGYDCPWPAHKPWGIKYEAARARQAQMMEGVGRTL